MALWVYKKGGKEAVHGFFVESKIIEDFEFDEAHKEGWRGSPAEADAVRKQSVPATNASTTTSASAQTQSSGALK